MSLLDYLAPLRRWWWLVAAGVLIAAAVTYLAVRRLPSEYAAHTTLMVGRAIQNPNPTDSDIFLTQQLANTYSDIARRQPVRKATQDALGLTVLPVYSVAIVPNTQLIELTVFDTNPQRAAAVANELATQLINQTPANTDSESRDRQSFVKSQLDDLQQKIKETRAETDKRQGELSGMYSARQISDAQAQIAALQTKLSTMQANYAALLANTEKGALNTIAVVEHADTPTVPVGPQRLSTVLLAAALGLLLSGAGAYVLSYLDDSIPGPNEVRQILGLRTLGLIPVAPGAPRGTMVVAGDLTTSAAEAYRMLRTNLQFSSGYESLHTLLVTSPAPGEGKSYTTANLAAVLAQTGQRVVIVDADIYNPSLHRVFNLPNFAGLTVALREDEADLTHVLQESGMPGLRVITSGPVPSKTVDLLGSPRMRKLLAALRASADIVVIDSPPVLALVDTTVLAALSDGVLLVLDASRSRRNQAVRAKHALEQVKAEILGVVLNRVPAHALEYHNRYWRMRERGSGSGGDGGHGKGGGSIGRVLGHLSPAPSPDRPVDDRSRTR